MFDTSQFGCFMLWVRIVQSSLLVPKIETAIVINVCSAGAASERRHSDSQASRQQHVMQQQQQQRQQELGRQVHGLQGGQEVPPQVHCRPASSTIELLETCLTCCRESWLLRPSLWWLACCLQSFALFHSSACTTVCRSQSERS